MVYDDKTKMSKYLHLLTLAGKPVRIVKQAGNPKVLCFSFFSEVF
jgi:hypothetical protein